MYAEGHALPGNRVTSPTWKVIPAASRLAASITPSPMSMSVAEARAAINARSQAGADAFATAVAPTIRQTQAAGAKSLREIAAVLNARGIATARRGRWEAETVANILRRVG
jgi:hypothetical protein